MGKFITQKTFLERLALEERIKFSRQSLYTYDKLGIFHPSRILNYGKLEFPLYEESDIKKFAKLVRHRYKDGEIRTKTVFLDKEIDAK